MTVISISDLKNQSCGGGKAINISRLKRAGLPTANGFILDVETSRLESGRLDIEKEIDKIGGYPLVVRSSGNLEDNLSNSFAGQLTSVVNVKSWDEFVKAYAKVLESVNKPSFLSYLENNNISSSKFEMYVLVQKYIKHDVSGVAFTMHPLKGDDELCLVECHSGEAEDLVSGKVSPIQANLDIFKRKNEKKLPLEILSLKKWEELKILFQKILSEFGNPQDIEWAWSKDLGFCIFQSRPMTTFSWRTDFVEMTNADFRDGGVSARPSIPIMYSLYKTAYEKGLESYLKSIGLKPFYKKEENWLDFQYGRIYWNSHKVKGYLKKLPDFDERAFDENLGLNKVYPIGYDVVTKLSIKSFFSALPVLILFPIEIKKYKSDLIDFRKLFLKMEEKTLKVFFDLEQLNDRDLFKWMSETLNYQKDIEVFYCRTISNSTMMQSVLQEKIVKIERGIKEKISLGLLLSHMSGVAHFESQNEIVILYEKYKNELKTKIYSAEFKKDLNTLLKKHYYRSFSELDLMQPRWFEEPESIYSMFLLEQKTSKSEELQFEKYLTSLKDEYLANNSKNKKNFLKFEVELAESRELLINREEVRQMSSKAYAWVRNGLIELGRRWCLSGILIEEKDVFFLQKEELLSLINKNKPALLNEKIESRKNKYNAFKNFNAPNEYGSALSPETREVQNTAFASDQSYFIKGLACSSGVYEGTARVIVDPQKMMELKEGEVLITKFTDPGWTPILGVAKAVVTEVGGMLSHAAVISREYGIPAVLNIGSVQISKIKSGQRIRVDGTAGTIHLL